jgi:Kef-type K+ transport system membrane component KefB
MRRIKNSLFYILTIGGFSAFIFFVIREGAQMEAGKVTKLKAVVESSSWEQFRTTYIHNITHPLAILLLQIVTIILAARFFGFLCRKIKQPSVIGEIIAGIVLGPSLVGRIYPEYSKILFPPSSLANLQFLSQIGLILFMFVVGMELDIKVLRKKAKDAVIISHASIIFPFALGVILAYFIYEQYAPADVNFTSFSLFTGIAMSITAFPVLARIVQEKGLAKTKIGTIAITCAAADDITAWCLLAAVIAIVKAGSVTSAVYTILLAVFYVFVMIRLVRPFLKSIGDRYAYREGLSKQVVAIFFITLIISSYVTEVIGIHALFGAFMAGVIMPANVKFRNIFIEKVEDVSLVLFLPLFFVFTGLRTQIGLLNGPDVWGTCGFIILVAVTGKFAGSALAARFVGQSWWESLTIGALMNTRGLMELVVLNIGYDLGVLSPVVFAMMVIMALVTTFMTAPALVIINRLFRTRHKEPVFETISPSKYNMLISFGNPQKGVSLLRLAYGLIGRSQQNATVTAMHLSPSNEINQYNFFEFEKESFRQVKSEAKKMGISLNQFFKPSQDIQNEIAQTANDGKFDILLIGNGRSALRRTALGRTFSLAGRLLNPFSLVQYALGSEKMLTYSLIDSEARQILRNCNVPAGVLIERHIEKLTKISACIFSEDDFFMVPHLERMLGNKDCKCHLWCSPAVTLPDAMKNNLLSFGHRISISTEKKPDRVQTSAVDLLVIAYHSLEESKKYQVPLRLAPAVLVLKDRKRLLNEPQESN